MKNLKLLNNKNFSILIIFLSIFTKQAISTEPVDIWTKEKTDNQKIENNENSQSDMSEELSSNSILKIQKNKKKEFEISEELNLSSKNLDIVG